MSVRILMSRIDPRTDHGCNLRGTPKLTRCPSRFQRRLPITTLATTHDSPRSAWTAQRVNGIQVALTTTLALDSVPRKQPEERMSSRQTKPDRGPTLCMGPYPISSSPTEL